MAFGTRVLAVTMAHDLVVPAARASVAHESHAVLAPEDLWGHSSILTSEPARALAYAFLRDHTGSCPPPARGAGWWEVAARGVWAGLSGLLGR